MTARERLDSERNIWVATVRPDGRPHLAPVWFVYVDDRIWVATGAESVRVGNLGENLRVAACLEEGDEPVVAEGDATVHGRLRPRPVVAAFATKYGWDITVGTDADVGTVVLVEIRPRKWLFGIDLPVVDAGPP